MTLVDIGCGDGRLLEEVLLQSPSRVGEVRLIDPDAELLSEAARCIGEVGFVRRIDTIHGGIEGIDQDSVLNADALLLVHVVYLLNPGLLGQFVKSLPVGVPAYIVLDSPRSVFTTLWERTAPRYHKRAIEAHQLLRDLPPEEFEASVTTVRSTVRNPLAVHRPDVRDALLSILCYREVSDTLDPALQDRSEELVVHCESTCYNITRR
jgi:hypothetical protein